MLILLFSWWIGEVEGSAGRERIRSRGIPRVVVDTGLGNLLRRGEERQVRARVAVEITHRKVTPIPVLRGRQLERRFLGKLAVVRTQKRLAVRKG
jgi:hypothetical protein